MRDTRFDLPSKARHKLIDILQPALATLIDLHSQAKQAHWAVRGPRFLMLHTLFDEIAEALPDLIDDLAERIAQIGGSPRGTIRSASRDSILDEYPIKASHEEQHVQALAEALVRACGLVRASIERATECGDPTTADLFTEVSRTLDKQLWFVESHL